MDVCGLYIGDTALSYGTMRSPVYRDYEKFPYGTLEDTKNPTMKDYYSKVQEKCQQMKEKKETKNECPFCKEQKKRPLGSYLRKREIKKSNEKICEEEHECSESEEILLSEESTDETEPCTQSQEKQPEDAAKK